MHNTTPPNEASPAAAVPEARCLDPLHCGFYGGLLCSACRASSPAAPSPQPEQSAAPQVVQGEVEREAFKSWASREYRNQDVYTLRDYENGLRAWLARATLASATPPADSKCAYPKCVGGEPNDGSCCRTPWRENCQQPENCRPDCSALECGGLLPAAQAETDAERLDAENLHTSFILQRKGVLPEWNNETGGHSSIEDVLKCVPYYKPTPDRPLRILEVRQRVAMDQAAIDASIRAGKGGE